MIDLTTNINLNKEFDMVPRGKAPMSICILTTIFKEIIHEKHFQYGLMIDGQPVIHPKGGHLYCINRVSSPEEFEKHFIGCCLEMASYLKYHLDKVLKDYGDYKVTPWIMIWSDEMETAHAFVTVESDYLYLFNMSFGKMGGIYNAKSYADALTFMAMGMSVFDQDRSKFLLNEYQFKPIPYDAVNKDLFKLSCRDYVRYCGEHYKPVDLQFDGLKMRVKFMHYDSYSKKEKQAKANDDQK